MFNEVAPEFGLPPLTRLPLVGAGRFDDLGMPRQATFPSANLIRHDALWDTPLWAIAGMTLRRMQTERVATNGQVAAAKAEGRTIDDVGVLVDIEAAKVPALLDGPSVWDRRRKGWPVAFALVVAVLALTISGWCLDAPEKGFIASASSHAACQFAMQQLASAVSPDWLPPALADLERGCGAVASSGLRDTGAWASYLGRSPLWGMVWDLVAVCAIGYLLARISSRSFTFLAGLSEPMQKWRAWLPIAGILPAAALFCDSAEDLLTMMAVVLQRVGAPLLVPWLLGVVGVFSLVKLLCYAASFGLFGSVRVLLVVWPGASIGKVGRRSASSAGS
jgi:hypothetical protein